MNIFSINNKLLAVTEVTTLLEFSSDNLKTLKEFRFEDKLKGQFSCAHP
ncbi:carotenoid oxygenase family protein [Francisella persica]|nr:carotenoid oxygenase family protein [Francisella persica]